MQCYTLLFCCEKFCTCPHVVITVNTYINAFELSFEKIVDAGLFCNVGATEDTFEELEVLVFGWFPNRGGVRSSVLHLKRLSERPKSSLVTKGIDCWFFCDLIDVDLKKKT